jgi:hypothetical protein
MADFPLWLKLLVYLIVGSTLVYFVIAMVKMTLG